MSRKAIWNSSGTIKNSHFGSRREKEENHRPEEYLGSEPGDTAWSRHVYLQDDLSLENNPLCYGHVIDRAWWRLEASRSLSGHDFT